MLPRHTIRTAVAVLATCFLAGCEEWLNPPVGFFGGMPLNTYASVGKLRIGGVYKQAHHYATMNAGYSEVCNRDVDYISPRYAEEALDDEDVTATPSQFVQLLTTNITIPQSYIENIRVKFKALSRTMLDEFELERIKHQLGPNCRHLVRISNVPVHILRGIVIAKEAVIKIRYRQENIPAQFDRRKVVIAGLPFDTLTDDGVAIHRGRDLVVEIYPVEFVVPR
jgi:hypothetical protein